MIEDSYQWLREGKQSKETTLINNISKNFNGNKLEKITKIMLWINENITYSKNCNQVIEIFANRTASKIIEDKWHTGCHDIATLFVTFSRAANIPTKYVAGISKKDPQNRGHCIAEVYVNNKWLSVDPTIRKISAEYFYEEYYVIGKGLDSWDVGIQTFNNWEEKSNKIIKDNSIKEK